MPHANFQAVFGPMGRKDARESALRGVSLDQVLGPGSDGRPVTLATGADASV
jgi:hypothetical protein